MVTYMLAWSIWQPLPLSKGKWRPIEAFLAMLAAAAAYPEDVFLLRSEAGTIHFRPLFQGHSALFSRWWWLGDFPWRISICTDAYVMYILNTSKYNNVRNCAQGVGRCRSLVFGFGVLFALLGSWGCGQLGARMPFGHQDGKDMESQRKSYHLRMLSLFTTFFFNR